MIDRCLREACEEAEDKPFRSEPLRAFLHGVPGAGKSQTVKWLRGFFEEICGWMQGQEFVYLASQNTQAALIDGNTLHSFAELQVKAPKQRRQTQFGPDKFVKCQRLRWLIVDECSTVALEVLAVLQKRLAEATRKKRSWKCRDTTHERPFGGVNFLCAGDFWQFPAVRATSLFQNPFSKGVSVQVANLHRLFWTHGEDGMQRLFELTKEHRCVDPWLSHVLLKPGMGGCPKRCGASYTAIPRCTQAVGARTAASATASRTGATDWPQRGSGRSNPAPHARGTSA